MENKEFVMIERAELISVLRDIEMMVVSFSHIGSCWDELEESEYYKMENEFLTDWDVARKLVKIRRALSEPFSYEVEEDGTSEIERLMEGVEHWSFGSRKPNK